MECIVQALVALTIMAPVLAAPGFFPDPLHQQPMAKAEDSLGGTRTSFIDLSSPIRRVSPYSPAEAAILSSSLELRKHKKSPSPNPCTSGDRYCHGSLDQVLFCNEDRQWVKYSECPAGTFCHRLHLVCVPEPPPAAFVPRVPSERDVDAGPAQCKEGDRRCSVSFNRVDRCNRSHDWVTYHDCRKSEVCDDAIFECLPRITNSPFEPLTEPGVISDGDFDDLVA
ncbi:hypothetical protein SAMD00023353_2900730 [Rosellinia necatrix]|uniref:Uncharacterized protein n=1 Tax=Rosellinia necatrix TaxID=77044 RepID=A0A1W2TJJ7_ROSNE|nr:hypothetical protein SAMD00023353_2900730 [Rosellinia necatrix]